jgi:hypothetical protein
MTANNIAALRFSTPVISGMVTKRPNLIGIGKTLKLSQIRDDRYLVSFMVVGYYGLVNRPPHRDSEDRMFRVE